MNDQSTISDFQPDPSDESEIYECEICERTFDSAVGRGSHRRSHDDEKIEQAMLKDLQRLAEKLGRTPKANEMADVGRFGSATYRSHFDSWNQALTEAGLDLNREQDISQQALLEELERVADKLGRPPKYSDMPEHSRYGGAVYSKKFGSWNEALVEAGFEPNREQNLSKQDLIEELHRLADELDRIPRHDEMTERSRYGSAVYSTKFGSWNNALREAGFEFNKERNVSESKLKEELNRLTDELGRTPTQYDMEDQGAYGYDTYRRAFGSWNNALREAGFEANMRRDIPRPDLIDEVERLANELGRTPTEDEMEARGQFASNTYAREFGSWNKTLKEAGLSLNNRSNIPDAELLEELERLADEYDRAPTKREMERNGAFGISTYATSFGSWSEAVQEVGLDVNAVWYPDRLDHLVRSTWELDIADLLLDVGVDYEYESLEIEYGDGRTYTPDFVTDNYVIEIKGYVYSNEVEKAKAAMKHLDTKEYVVIGRELPADIHIEFEERAALHNLFE